MSNKHTVLQLRHPADTALIGEALNQFHRDLNLLNKRAQAGFPLVEYKSLCAVYAKLTAVHLAPRLQGERVCVHCGCSDNHACHFPGCVWSIKHKATPTGVCSQCVPKEIKLVDSL